MRIEKHIIVAAAVAALLLTPSAKAEELCVGATLRESKVPEPRDTPGGRDFRTGNLTEEDLTLEDEHDTASIHLIALSDQSGDEILTDATPQSETHMAALVTISCKYDYEAYVARGSCRGRDGGHNTRARVTLSISSPGHLSNVRRTATQYVQFDDTVNGYDLNCADACASATATMSDGRVLRRSRRCNIKSYK